MSNTEFENLVAQMRDAQMHFEYTNSRTTEKNKKQLEKRVDEYLAQRRQVVTQSTLF